MEEKPQLVALTLTPLTSQAGYETTLWVGLGAKGTIQMHQACVAHSTSSTHLNWHETFVIPKGATLVPVIMSDNHPRWSSQSFQDKLAMHP